MELQHSQSRTSGVAVDHVPMFVGDTLVCQWDVREDSLPEGMLDSLFADYAEPLPRQLADGRRPRERRGRRSRGPLRAAYRSGRQPPLAAPRATSPRN